MSAPQQQQPMIHPTMGATALQAQPARQPILKDEMAALDRLVSRQPERVERAIDDRPFIAPPASEPAMRAQPQVAEPVVPQSRMQQPAPQPQMPAPQMSAQAPSLQMPSPHAPVAQPPALTIDPPHVEQRRRAPSLFEKVTSRLTGQQTPKAPPAPQAPRPQAERQRRGRAGDDPAAAAAGPGRPHVDEPPGGGHAGHPGVPPPAGQLTA